MYYNTTGETNPQLALFRRKAANDRNTLLRFFREHAEQDFTRDELRQQVLTDRPVSSFCAHLNALEKLGHVERTGDYRQGVYGRRQGVYKYCGGAK
jgi:hypothetical protein